MNKYQFNFENYHISLGWEQTLRTFYAILKKTKTDDNVIAWRIGNSWGSIKSVEHLQEQLSPYGLTIPEDISAKLEKDSKEPFSPKIFQTAFEKIVKKVAPHSYNSSIEKISIIKSQYQFHSGKYQVEVGWEQDCKNFYAFVSDLDVPEDPDGLVWIGSLWELIKSVEHLQEKLSPYGLIIPQDIFAKLEKDSEQLFSPTIFQTAFEKIFREDFASTLALYRSRI